MAIYLKDRTLPILALTLDLDDTLWPIAPVIARAEQVMHAWFEQQHPQIASAFPIPVMRALREQVWQAHPHLQHDFTQTRLLSLRQAMLPLGASEADVEQAFALFFTERNRVTFFDGALAQLETLSRCVPIVALSNGNADLTRIGIAGLFAAQFSARQVGVAKPAPEIFLSAARALDLAPAQILHIGDHAEQDILGALRAGMAAAWIAPLESPWQSDGPTPTLRAPNFATLARALLTQMSEQDGT
jgi:FMN hydrolase / 5-amino-6-(5-phospho-D-ribitylamino)uracil phosphatase